MPLAPSLATVSFSVRPLLVQEDGGEGNEDCPRICTGTAAAFSPAICTSAVATGPQLNELVNCAHSPTGDPSPAVSPGSDRLSCEASMRRPEEPVSTKMSGMVWQVEVPGSHSVTLV